MGYRRGGKERKACSYAKRISRLFWGFHRKAALRVLRMTSSNSRYVCWPVGQSKRGIDA